MCSKCHWFGSTSCPRLYRWHRSNSALWRCPACWGAMGGAQAPPPPPLPPPQLAAGAPDENAQQPGLGSRNTPGSASNPDGGGASASTPVPGHPAPGATEGPALPASLAEQDQPVRESADLPPGSTMHRDPAACAPDVDAGAAHDQGQHHAYDDGGAHATPMPQSACQTSHWDGRRWTPGWCQCDRRAR